MEKYLSCWNHGIVKVNTATVGAEQYFKFFPEEFKVIRALVISPLSIFKNMEEKLVGASGHYPGFSRTSGAKDFWKVTHGMVH